MVVAGRNNDEQSAFETKIRQKTQERIKSELKEIQLKTKKKTRKKCNCGRIK